MKKIKYILFTAVILSFIFITACSTTQSVPQDDVYYSTTPHNNVTAQATTANTVSSSVTKQQKAEQAGNTGYRQGKVENISQSSGKSTSGDKYDVNYSAQLKRFHQSNDTSIDYYDKYYTGQSAQDSSQQSKTIIVTSSPNVSLNLGFDSPNFGTSWSFGFGSSYGGWGYPSYGWGGSYYGWGYPSYGWGYPSYGWGFPSYGWGYPSYGWGGGYYGWGYPSYGWGGDYYGWGYPGYGWGGYSSYYSGYPDHGYRNGTYQPRVNRGGGSSVPRGTVVGGSGVYTSPKGRSAGKATGVVSHKRSPVNPEGRNDKMTKPNGNIGRPAGSMRYDAALAKRRSDGIRTQDKLNKPDGSAVRKGSNGGRSSKFGISESRNRAAEGYHKPPAYRREENMPRPRFQKPKQYQSLESRSTRSSKEFYRTPTRPSNPEYRRTGTRTIRPHTERRQNVYRPANTRRNSVYRGRSSRTRSDVKVYNNHTRSFSSPNSFRAPARRNSSSSERSRSFSAPTRTYSAPPPRTRSTSGSGGGGVRRGSGSGGGGIRR